MKRNKKQKNYLNSIKVREFITVLLAMAIPVIVCNMVMVNVAYKNYISQRTEKYQVQNTMLKNCIISENYLETLDSALVKAEANRVASGYDGRVEIINSDYIVVSDTYITDEGKICISDRVMKSMKGEAVSFYNKNNDYIEFATPITISNTTVVTANNSTIEDEEKSSVIGTLYVKYSTNDWVTFRATLYTYAIAIDVMVLVLAIGFAIFTSRHIQLPFKRVEEALAKITDGEIGEKIEIKGYTEMRKMGEAINHLLDKLNKQEQSRQEFVSNVSHELKTPITSMKVLADSLIGQKEIPEELYQEFLTDIGKEIDRENDIITDLLSLVKTDRKSAEINIGQSNINELVEQTLKRLRPIAAAKNIELVFESFRPIVADVDDVKITIVISNLVENAIKYNVNDGWVRVSLNADHQYFYLKVSDSGIGIQEEDQENVFERFFRVDKARSRETGGTGLGLAITKQIVLMHRGSIKVHSKEDEGTTFTVRVPLKYIV